MTTYQAVAARATLTAPRSAFVRAFTSTRWMGCALAIAALAIAYFVVPTEITRSVYNPMGGSAIVALFTGIGRVGNRRIWRLLGSGIVSYALADIVGTAGLTFDGTSVHTAAASALYVGAYALIATGLTAIVASTRAARR